MAKIGSDIGTQREAELHPVDYRSPDALDPAAMARRRRRSLPLDIPLVVLGLWFAAIVPAACKVNVDESPVYGGGSSYNGRAPCNAAWVRGNPKLATLIRSAPFQRFADLAILPAALCYISRTVPYALLAGLGWRAWAARRWQWRRWRVLLVVAVLLALATPWIHECAIVLLD